MTRGRWSVFRRPSLSTALGVLVSAISLGAVVWWISRQDSPRLPESGMGFAWLGVALLVIACSHALRGWRWHRVMWHAGVPHRVRDAFGLTLVGYMGNNVLPARGGELMRVGLMGNHTTARRREVLGTVIADRLLDTVVLVALFAMLTWAGVKGSRGSAAAGLAGLAIGAAALTIYVRLRRRGRLERFAATIRPVARAARLFVSPHGVPLALLTLLVWCLEGLTFMLLARAVGVTLDVLPALAVVVLASLFAAIPAAPGYVGTFDAGLLVGLGAAGVEGGDAVGVLLMARFMFFVPVTLVGLGTLVFGYGGLRERGRAPSDPLPRTVASGQRGTGA
jgi:uncharacterized membrane protein YbhN (UPF0104 family)